MLIAFRIAAGLLAFGALGFGIPAVIGAIHHARTGQVWQLWGFPSYGPGRFGATSTTLTILMVLFAVACAIGLVAAVLLWIPAPLIAVVVVVALAIAAQAVFWIGFQLPFGPPIGVAAAVLVTIGSLVRT